MENQKNPKVKILRPIFLFATLTGMWTPTEHSPKLIRLYKFYLTCLILSYPLSMIAQFTLLVSMRNFKDFTNIFYLFLTEIIICVKFAVVNLERNKLFEVKSLLLQEPCLPSNEEENKIRKEYDNFNRYFSPSYQI